MDFLFLIFMNIGIDIMGGDYAPAEALKGIQTYLKGNPKGHIVLVGNEAKINDLLPQIQLPNSSYTIAHCTEVIGMHEHPTKALKEKQNSSIAIGFGLLQASKSDAFISAGNTGAMMVGSMYTVKNIEGILRPTIASPVPRTDGKFNLLLDVGI